MKEYLNNIEYMECVKDILNSGIFKKLDGYVQHGCTKNAKKYFNITNKEASMIKTHMFPLTPIPPLSREGWVLTMADKSTSINEIIANMKNVHRAGEGTV